MTDETMDEAKLRELAALTAQLPREVEPPPEAWARIRSLMELDASPGSRRARDGVAIWQRPAFLIAASLLLVAGSSAVTAVVVGNRTSSPPAVSSTQGGPAPSVSPSPATTVSTLTQFTRRENDYLRRVNGLIAVMESDEIELAPQTIAKVKESLAIIDAAILEARAALARDPANRELIEMLESTYEKKLDLLQRTTAMARS